jgi:hypothetical protein
MQNLFNFVGPLSSPNRSPVCLLSSGVGWANPPSWSSHIKLNPTCSTLQLNQKYPSAFNRHNRMEGAVLYGKTTTTHGAISALLNTTLIMRIGCQIQSQINQRNELTWILWWVLTMIIINLFQDEDDDDATLIQREDEPTKPFTGPRVSMKHIT